MLIYLDGHFVPKEKALVSVFDHGFLYGDGIYETMRAYEGRIFLVEQHLDRLKRSARAISLKLPLPLEKIGEALNRSLKINKLRDAYVRLHISRGPGEIGLDPALCSAPTMVIVARQFHDYPAHSYERGVKVAVVKTRRNHPLALPPSVKGTNFLNNILAKIESLKAGAYEGIMLNWEGYVAEGTISNIFMVKKGVLYTPGLDTGILAGVTRDLVLKLARRNKVRVEEGPLLPRRFYAADECFITNTTMEIMPVAAIDRKKIGNGRPGPVTALLQQAYKDTVLAWLKTQPS
ncbi:MAG TPA: branched-chain-amino-acid transaminase [Nitrospirota bacterium]